MIEREINLRKDVVEYVSNGGHDAFSFALLSWPKYKTVPGSELQSLIDEEKSRLKNLSVDVRKISSVLMSVVNDGDLQSRMERIKYSTTVREVVTVGDMEQYYLEGYGHE